MEAIITKHFVEQMAHTLPQIQKSQRNPSVINSKIPTPRNIIKYQTKKEIESPWNREYKTIKNLLVDEQELELQWAYW